LYIVILSALEDMVKQGVKVFFVNKEVYEQIMNAPDHGESIVNNLVAYTG